jgi:hypothetical protein
MLNSIFTAVYSFFQNLIAKSLAFLGNLLGFLFQKLIDFLKILFSPILILIAMIFYVISKVGTLIVTLIAVLIGIGKIFVSLIKGIFATLAGFSYTPTTPSNGQWTSIFQNVVGGLDFFQIDTLAYILLFLIWFATAFAAVNIISSMKGGS